MLLIKILKLNALALLSIPLLIISVTGKLCEIILSKLSVIIKVAICSGTVIFISEVGRLLWVQSFWSIIFTLIISAVLAGILFIGIKLAEGIILIITLYTMKIFGCMFDKLHNIYSKFYDKCKTEYYGFLNIEWNVLYVPVCIFWTLLRIINFTIAKLLAIAFPLSIMAFTCIAAFSMWFINSSLIKSFGIDIFGYHEMFGVTDTVFSLFYLLILLAGTAIILVSLGKKWKEWGILFDLSTKNYEVYRSSYIDKESELVDDDFNEYMFETGVLCERYQKEMTDYSNMVDEHEFLAEQVDTALSISEDNRLRYDYNKYLNILTEVKDNIAVYTDSKIPADEYERVISPAIKEAVVLQKNILKRAQEIIAFYATSSVSSAQLDLFKGCINKEEVKKRYKLLSQIFHPDKGGNHETFTILHDQYETVLMEMI